MQLQSTINQHGMHDVLEMDRMLQVHIHKVKTDKRGKKSKTQNVNQVAQGEDAQNKIADNKDSKSDESTPNEVSNVASDSKKDVSKT